MTEEKYETGVSREKVTSTAVVDTERYGPYAEEIKKTIEDQEHVRNNIAIIGPYGSGKSSLIKTFDEEYKKSDQKSLYISLAAFNNSTYLSSKRDDKNNLKQDPEVDNQDSAKTQNRKNSDETELSNNLDYERKYVTEQEIEKSILQQFLFKVSHKELPHSKINRIKERGKLFWTIPLLIGIILLSLGLSYINQNSILWKESFLSIKIISISALAISVFLFLYFAFYTFNFTKIKLKDIEAEFWNDSNTSLFNKYLDELIYFFKKTKYTIVYIEDLDRIENCLPLFVKLRELNFVINNHKEIDNNIKFIYALGEDVFLDSNERSKFFDKIISIVPFVNINNVKDKLTKWITDNSQNNSTKKLFIGLEKNKTELFVNNMSSFLLDNRILVNIYEDYLNYASNISKSANFYELFSLMVYKNLYPTDFSKLFFGEGLLIDAFEKFKEVRKEEVKKIDEEIVHLENKLEFHNKEFITSIDELKLLFAGYIAKNNIYSSYNTSFQNLEFELVKDNDGFYLSNNGLGNTFGNINKICKDKNGYDFRERYSFIKAKIENKKNEVLRYIEEKRKLRIGLYKYSIKEILDNIPSKEIEKYFLENKFIGICIKNQYLSENCISLISGNENIYLDKQHNDFLLNTKLGLQSPYDYQLSNPYLIVLETIDLNRFSHFSILNYDLVRYLLNSADKILSFSEKKETLVTYLNSEDPLVDEFIISYFSTQDAEDILLLLDNLKDKNNLYDLISKGIKDNSMKENVVQEILDNDENYSILSDKNFSSFLCDFESMNNLVYKDKVIERLKDLKVSIKDISSFKDVKIIRELIVANLIEYNKKNLSHFSFLKGNQSEFLSLNSLFIESNEKVKEILLTESSKILEVFKGSDQDLDESIFKELLDSLMSNEEGRKVLIESFNYKLTEIPKLNKEDLSILCERMSFVKKLDLIYELSKHIEFEKISKYFEKTNFNTIDLNLSSEKKNEADFIGFKYKILNSLLYNDKMPLEIIDKLEINELNITKLNIPTENHYTYDIRLSTLIKKSLFKYSDKSFDKLLSITESLTEYVVAYEDNIIESITNGLISITKEVCDSVLLIKKGFNLKKYIFENYTDLVEINMNNYHSLITAIKNMKFSNTAFLNKLFLNQLFMQDMKFAFELLNDYIDLFNKDELLLALSKFDMNYLDLQNNVDVEVNANYFNDNIKNALVNLGLIKKALKLNRKNTVKNSAFKKLVPGLENSTNDKYKLYHKS